MRAVAIFIVRRELCGDLSTGEGEAIGLLEALSWIKHLNIAKVVVEIDAKLVVYVVNGGVRDVSIFGNIIGACKQELSSFQHCLIQ